jgi:hypothetical protein
MVMVCTLKERLELRILPEVYLVCMFFRNDPYEKADHNLLGTDVQYLFSKDWRLNAKLYSGMSFYEADHSTKPSLGVESQYSRYNQ